MTSLIKKLFKNSEDRYCLECGISIEKAHPARLYCDKHVQHSDRLKNRIGASGMLPVVSREEYKRMAQRSAERNMQ